MESLASLLNKIAQKHQGDTILFLALLSLFIPCNGEHYAFNLFCNPMFPGGLKQDLPPEVLAKLAEMGLSEDDVEVRLQLSFDAIARAAKSKKAWIIGAKGVGGPALNDRIVQYPPGTDPDAALNDFYSRQAGGGGRGGVGGGGRSYSTAVPPSQTYEQPRSALDGFFSEDLFEIPAILAFE
eukprot:scaffold269669_cov15-Tisochrysis_lutea.AAC.1